MLRREINPCWGTRSIHEITKRDVVELVSCHPSARYSGRCQQGPKDDQDLPALACGTSGIRSVARRWGSFARQRDLQGPVLTDDELVRVIVAARTIGEPYGAIVEFLALTGQRRAEAAQCTWDEIDLRSGTWTLPRERTKNAKLHIVHLSDQSIAVLTGTRKLGKFVFSRTVRAHSRILARPSASWTFCLACPDGGFMICAGPVSPEWPGSVSRHILRTDSQSPVRYDLRRSGRLPAS